MQSYFNYNQGLTTNVEALLKNYLV